MIITVQCIDRRWRLIHPDYHQPFEFETGTAAFDAAAGYAHAHNAVTGTSTAVQMEALSQRIEVLRVG